MDLTTPETVSRAVLTVVALYTAALAGFAWRLPPRARVWGAVCVLAVAAYAQCTSAGVAGGIDHWIALLRAPVVFLCAALPAVFWAFVAVLFDDADDNDWLRVAVVMGLGLLGLIASTLATGDGYSIAADLLAGLRRMLAVALAAWSLWRLWRGRETDLVNTRLGTRFVLLGAAGVYMIAVLIVELTLHNSGALRSMLVVNLFAVAAILVTLGVLMSRWDLLPPTKDESSALEIAQNEPSGPDNLPGPGSYSQQPAAPAAPTTDNAAHNAIEARLQQAMQHEHLYRQEKLSISTLASRLGTSEYHLRAVINQRMGFRNFNDFLHRYRLTEAASRLSDPAQAATPVLTIALEVGYASIGPFNRAFKQRFGCTPTTYRQQYLAPANGPH